MSDADDLLEELRAAGTEDSSGRFTLDPKVALEKLRRYRLQERHEYVLSLVAAAVRSGATRFDAFSSPGEFTVRFDGQPFTRPELEELFDRLLRGEARPALADLAAGVHGATALEPRSLVLESWDANGGSRLVVEGGEPAVADLDPVPEGSGTRVVLKESPSWAGLRRFLAGAVGSLPEMDLLHSRACYAPLKVMAGVVGANRHAVIRDALVVRILETRDLPQAHFPAGDQEAPVSSLQPAPGPFEAVLGLGPREEPLWALVAGVCHPFPREALAWPELAGVVSAPGLRLDLSRSQVVRDEALETLARHLDDQAAAMVLEAARRHQGLTEPQRTLVLQWLRLADQRLAPDSPLRVPMLEARLVHLQQRDEEQVATTVHLVALLRLQGRFEEAQHHRSRLRQGLFMDLLGARSAGRTLPFAEAARLLAMVDRDEPSASVRAQCLLADALGWSGHEALAREAWKRAVAEADALPAGNPAAARRALALDGLALSLRREGLLKDAVPLHQEARRLREAHLPEEHPDRARSPWLLAGAAMAVRDAETAFTLFSEACRRFGPTREPWRRRAFDGATEALVLAGRWDEALARCQEAMAERGWGEWYQALVSRPARGEDALLAAMLLPLASRAVRERVPRRRETDRSRFLGLASGLLGRMVVTPISLLSPLQEPSLPAAGAALSAQIRGDEEAALKGWREALEQAESRGPEMGPDREILGWRLVHFLRLHRQPRQADPLWVRLDGLARWRHDLDWLNAPTPVG